MGRNRSTGPRHAGRAVGGALHGARHAATRLRAAHRTGPCVVGRLRRHGVALHRIGCGQGFGRSLDLRLPRHGCAVVHAARQHAAAVLQRHQAHLVAHGLGRSMARRRKQHRPVDFTRAVVLGRRVRFLVRAPIRGRVRVHGAGFHRGLRSGEHWAVRVLRLPGHGRHFDSRPQELARGTRRHPRHGILARMAPHSFESTEQYAHVCDEKVRWPWIVGAAPAVDGLLPSNVAGRDRCPDRNVGERSRVGGQGPPLLLDAHTRRVHRAVCIGSGQQPARRSIGALRSDRSQLLLL